MIELSIYNGVCLLTGRGKALKGCSDMSDVTRTITFKMNHIDSVSTSQDESSHLGNKVLVLRLTATNSIMTYTVPIEANEEGNAVSLVAAIWARPKNDRPRNYKLTDGNIIYSPDTTFSWGEPK